MPARTRIAAHQRDQGPGVVHQQCLLDGPVAVALHHEMNAPTVATSEQGPAETRLRQRQQGQRHERAPRFAEAVDELDEEGHLAHAPDILHLENDLPALRTCRHTGRGFDLEGDAVEVRPLRENPYLQSLAPVERSRETAHVEQRRLLRLDHVDGRGRRGVAASGRVDDGERDALDAPEVVLGRRAGEHTARRLEHEPLRQAARLEAQRLPVGVATDELDAKGQVLFGDQGRRRFEHRRVGHRGDVDGGAQRPPVRGAVVEAVGAVEVRLRHVAEPAAVVAQLDRAAARRGQQGERCGRRCTGPARVAQRPLERAVLRDRETQSGCRVRAAAGLAPRVDADRFTLTALVGAGGEQRCGERHRQQPGDGGGDGTLEPLRHVRPLDPDDGPVMSSSIPYRS